MCSCEKVPPPAWLPGSSALSLLCSAGLFCPLSWLQLRWQYLNARGRHVVSFNCVRFSPTVACSLEASIHEHFKLGVPEGTQKLFEIISQTNGAAQSFFRTCVAVSFIQNPCVPGSALAFSSESRENARRKAAQLRVSDSGSDTLSSSCRLAGDLET